MKQKLSYLSRETAVESWRQGFYSSLFDLSKRRSSRYFHAGLSLVSKGKWVELICWSYFYSFCQFYAIKTHNKPTIRRSASNKVININENSNWNAHLLHSTKTQGVWGFSGILTCFPFISEERVWLFFDRGFDWWRFLTCKFWQFWYPHSTPLICILLTLPQYHLLGPMELSSQARPPISGVHS